MKRLPFSAFSVSARIRTLLLASYASLVFTVACERLPGAVGAKLTVAGPLLLAALAGGLVRLAVDGHRQGIRLPPVVPACFTYLALLFASMVLNPGASYDPLNAVASMFVGICLMAVLGLTTDDAATIRRIVMFLGVLAGVVGLLGVGEYFGLVFYDLNYGSGQAIRGTFGNQNHLGGYLCVSLPFILLVGAAGQTPLLRFGAWIMAACTCLAALMTGSRVTLAAVFFAFVAFGLLTSLFVFNPLARFRSARPVARVVTVLSAAAAVAAVGAWTALDGRFIERFAHIADPGKFIGVRLYMYRAAIIIWQDTPWSILFGHGPGAYYKQSPAVLEPEVPAIESYTHVHNEILENLVEGGIAGLLVYLLITGATLWRLFGCIRDRSLPSSIRLTAVALATSLLAFEMHGLLSISTRTLVVGHTFYWIVGLSWALWAAVRKNSGILLHGRPAAAAAVVAMLLMAWASYHLGVHAYADNLLAAGRIAEESGRPAEAERRYQAVLAMDGDNVQASYFLAHLYLVHQVPAGFERFAAQTSRIIPQYRTIDYFQALMDLNAGRDQAALEGFQFFKDNVFRKDRLTLFWLAWLNHRQGNTAAGLDYLVSYLKARFPERKIMISQAGKQIVVIPQKSGAPLILVGQLPLGEIVARMPCKGEPAEVFRRVSGALARLFENHDFELWMGLYGDYLGGEKSDRMAQAIQSRLDEVIANTRATNRREDAKKIIGLYEILIRYSSEDDILSIRNLMLNYYIKSLQFKKFSHWKRRIQFKSIDTRDTYGLDVHQKGIKALRNPDVDLQESRRPGHVGVHQPDFASENEIRKPA